MVENNYDQEQRELKQDYLRTEILEKNYSTEDFLTFLIGKYGDDAADIDRYEFENLKTIVNEFKKSFEPSSDEVNKDIIYDSQMDMSNTSNEKKSSSLTEEDKAKDLEYIKKLKTEEYEDVIQSEKMILSEISFQNINIEITKPEKIDGGFFSKSYITYLITTSAPYNFEVRRRYSDFEWLRSILSCHFPSFLIPPIPLKNFSDRFNDEFVEKRMRYLQKFLNSIVANPTLFSSVFFYDFLTVTKEADFANIKKNHNKLKPPSKLGELKSVDGAILCRLTSVEEAELDKIKVYENFNENSLQKLSTSFKALNNEMVAVCNRMGEISDIFEQLCIISLKTTDDKTVTDTYKLLKKLMKEWGNTFIQQKDLIDVEIREHLNYIKRELICFKEVSFIIIILIFKEYH